MNKIQNQGVTITNHKMAAGGVGVISVLKFFIVCTLIKGYYTHSNNPGHRYYDREHHDYSDTTQLLSFRTLHNFNGYFLIEGFESVGDNMRAGLRPRYDTTRKYVTILQNTGNSGFLNKLFITMLARCGDINPNPGPDQSVIKRKYTHKYACSVCSAGINARRVQCKEGCGRITHARCISGITNAMFDILSSNGETINYTCNICAHSAES